MLLRMDLAQSDGVISEKKIHREFLFAFGQNATSEAGRIHKAKLANWSDSPKLSRRSIEGKSL